MLSQTERLIACSPTPSGPCSSCSPARPTPRTAGQGLILQIGQFARKVDVRPRFVFVEDYDMAIATELVPRRRRVAEHAAPSARGVRHGAG